MFAPRSHILQPASRCRTAFMCCDIQEKLVNKIPNFMDAVNVANTLARLHAAMPKGSSVYVATEQFPQGVGHTFSGIKLPPGTPVAAKLYPSMLASDIAPYILGDKERGLEPVQQAVLWGHETQVCILQTADALLQNNIRVAVMLDGCSAQQEVDHNASVMTMASWPGVTLTTTISVVMQLAAGDGMDMTELMKIVKGHPKYAGRNGDGR